MAIFDKLKSILGSTGGIIKEDMKRLDKHSADLSRKAFEYIVSGSNETVLSTLAQKMLALILKLPKSGLAVI